MQGYWFARPMPADQMEDALRESQSVIPRVLVPEPGRMRRHG
jgi:predicted signal transduction protein with EAL and GGDEF domain